MKHFERGRHSRGRNNKSVGSKSWNGKNKATFDNAIQSLCQNWLDFHTFSVSLPQFAGFSYFFSLLVKIGQIFIPFSVSFSKLAKFSYFFHSLPKFATCQPPSPTMTLHSTLGNWGQSKKFGNQSPILKCLIPSEPEWAAEMLEAHLFSVSLNKSKMVSNLEPMIGRRCKISGLSSLFNVSRLYGNHWPHLNKSKFEA